MSKKGGQSCCGRCVSFLTPFLQQSADGNELPPVFLCIGFIYL